LARPSLVRAPLVCVVVAAGLVLSACGYHLRGQGAAALNFATVAVDGGEDDPALVERVKDAFDRESIAVVATDYERRVEINATSRQRSISAVDSAGNVAVYALEYVATFSYYDAKGNGLLNNVQVKARSEYDFNAQEVLGKDQEQEWLFRKMRDDLVRDMMRRIGRAERNASE
jgi:LPS-assembly lipoprotein